MHKGRTNVIKVIDDLRISPVEGVKSAGRGQGIGRKGGVVIGVKGAGCKTDDDEGMAYASDDPKNALNISVPSKPTVNVNIRSPKKTKISKSDAVYEYLSDLFKAEGDPPAQKGQPATPPPSPGGGAQLNPTAGSKVEGMGGLPPVSQTGVSPGGPPSEMTTSLPGGPGDTPGSVVPPPPPPAGGAPGDPTGGMAPPPTL